MRMRGLLASLLTALTGCVSVAAEPADTRAQAQCAVDGQGQWVSSDHRIHDLLLLGYVKDPSLTGGRSVLETPYTVAVGEPEAWMNRTGLRQVDMYLRPDRGSDDRHLYGPKIGQPEGVYRFERRPLGSPECADYDAARAFDATLSGVRIAPIKACVAWRYLGPQPEPHATTFIYFSDVSYEATNIDRTESRLVGPDGQLVGRGAFYGYRNDKRPGDCFARSGRGVEQLFN